MACGCRRRVGAQCSRDRRYQDQGWSEAAPPNRKVGIGVAPWGGAEGGLGMVPSPFVPAPVPHSLW